MNQLQQFVGLLLAKQGAVVDAIDPEGLEVLAPPPAQHAMRIPEWARLGFGAELPAHAQRVSLDADLLERLGGLLGEHGRYTRQVRTPENPPPGHPERILEHTLELHNAVYRLQDVKPAWTRYVIFRFRYTAISDEKREELVWLGFNLGTGAVMDDDFLRRLRTYLASVVDWQVPDPDAPLAAGVASVAAIVTARVERLIEHHVRLDLEPFLNAMRRRLYRDRGRVHAYHDELRRTAQLKLAALGSASGEKAEADRRRETFRIAAIEREYAAKLDDLRHNYDLRVTVDWVQGLTLFAPVHRYDVLIKRRKGERTMRIDWHPAIRMIEPPPSDWGLGIGRARLVCDDHLHLTDPTGQSPCPSCGKAWCRACHSAACPRCGHAA